MAKPVTSSTFQLDTSKQGPSYTKQAHQRKAVIRAAAGRRSRTRQTPEKCPVTVGLLPECRHPSKTTHRPEPKLEAMQLQTWMCRIRAVLFKLQGSAFKVLRLRLVGCKRHFHLPDCDTIRCAVLQFMSCSKLQRVPSLRDLKPAIKSNTNLAGRVHPHNRCIG